jgi:hypothetical protein
VIGGGQTPPVLALVACAAATTWVAVLIGRQRASLPLLVVAVAAGQLILHTAFSITTSDAVLVGSMQAGHAHVGQGGVLLASAGHAGGVMWLAHALAGIVTVIAIRRGEQALRGLGRVARTAIVGLTRRLAGAAIPAARPARPVPAPRWVATSLFSISAGLGSALVRRGPPALVR